MKKTLYAKLAIGMAVTYQVLLIMLIFIRPDIHPYSNTISEWEIGKFGWIMQLAFFCSALSYLFLFASLKDEIQGIWGKIGLALLFICFLGTAGPGIFITNPYPPDFTIIRTLIHTICGTAAMALLPLAALFINFNIARHNPEWANEKNTLRWTAFLPLAALIGFLIQLILFVIPLGKNAVGDNVPIGYPPRILFLTYHIWLTILAINFIKLKTSKTTSHDI